MRALIIIVLSLMVLSCTDDDKWFSPPKDFSVQIHNEINYYRLMSGRPVIEYSSFIEAQVFLHAQYIESVDSISYVNQAERFTKIKEALSINRCFEYAYTGLAAGKWVLNKLASDPASTEAMLNATFFGVAAVKNGEEHFIVIIFAS